MPTVHREREIDLSLEVSHLTIAERICGVANHDGPVPSGSHVAFRYLYHRDTAYTYGLILEYDRKPVKRKLETLKAWLAGAAAMAKGGSNV